MDTSKWLSNEINIKRFFNIKQFYFSNTSCFRKMLVFFFGFAQFFVIFVVLSLNLINIGSL